MDNLNPFAVSSSGFPSLGDGFPSMGGDVSVGYPSLGEISMSRPPKRGVLVRNVPADAAYEIRVLDKDYKLGITAVVESVRAHASPLSPLSLPRQSRLTD
jgi:hypothetical protein